MKLFGRSLKEYLSFSWKYTLCVFAASLAMFLLVQSGFMQQVSFNPFGIISLAATFAAGFSAAKRKFGAKQTIVVGLFCFIGVVWLVPLAVMPLMEQLGVPQEALLPSLAIVSLVNGAVNLAIYEAAVMLGFWLGSRKAR
ncbi:MAG: hypothetical protein V1813_03065 [Candidatus Aenigmatarchaeota archaeon]